MAELDERLRETLRRLHVLLPPRIGPHAAAEVLKNFGRMMELGTPTAAALQAAQSTLDAFADRPPIASPLSSATSRAIATVAPKKLAHFAFIGRTPWQLPDVVVAGVADHADALMPAFGETDFALGVAWQNVLTYHCALVATECWNRNDPAPVHDLAAEAADARLDDVDVPMCLVRGEGLFIVRGHAPPREDAPFHPRELHLILRRHGGGRDVVGVVGDGSWAGVQDVLRALKVPLSTASLPLLLSLVTLPCGPGEQLIDEDGVIGDLAADEDRLEQARFTGSAARTRLGVAGPQPPSLPTLRLRVGGTRLTLRAGDTRAVLDVE
jgi:hypothetical protein